MDLVVISIGGSVILAKEANIGFLNNLSNLLIELSKKFRIYIVVGGGITARNYIDIGRKLDLDELILDELGIDVTRINAKLITNIIKISNKKIPLSIDEAMKIDTPIVIMGGTQPGHSTDLVGAKIAEKMKASRFIIASNVNGIYDRDPNKFSNAKQLKEVFIDKLIKKYGTEWRFAGSNIIIDGPAMELIYKAKISTFVVNGLRLDQLEKVINGQLFDGTSIIV
jgi:uridylate kinase